MARILALLALLLAACHVDPAKPRPRAGVAPALIPDAGPAVDPLARRVCELVWGLPASRKAACCKRPVPANESAACAQALTRAVRQKALSIDESHLATCAGELEKQTQDCDWVTRGLPRLPTLCSEGLILGNRGEGQPCISTLECGGTLHCMVSDGGAVCARPQPVGAPCELAPELLAPLLRIAPDVEKHACEGLCRAHRCIQPVAEGGDCAWTSECARGLHCGDGHCVIGATARLGEPCAGEDCEEGTRCVQGACRALKTLGASCASDEECLGRCVSGDGGGTCQMACDPG